MQNLCDILEANSERTIELLEVYLALLTIAKPSTKDEWNRICDRMLALHLELGGKRTVRWKRVEKIIWKHFFVCDFLHIRRYKFFVCKWIGLYVLYWGEKVIHVVCLFVFVLFCFCFVFVFIFFKYNIVSLKIIAIDIWDWKNIKRSYISTCIYED